MNTEQFNGHTPGPWNVNDDLGMVIKCGGGPHDFVSMDNDANVRLMAAAPELLDLLKDARRMVQELHALLNGVDGDEAYEWALRNVGEQEMAWWRTYYVRRS